MLESIHIKNCFTHTNRTVVFDEGLTCITGPNEAGKSLILEMVAYALFGNKALRGSRPDKLHVDLSFNVKNISYRVVRSASKATLYRTGVEVATGVTPVNAAVTRALGYDYTVFTMGNLCGQGQIEALGAMKPAERKRAVDQTIGLTALDSLTKWVGEETLSLSRQAEAIERTLHEPTPPTKPEDYLPSGEVEEQRKQAVADLRELLDIEAFLRTEPTVPEEPVDPSPGEDLADIEQSVAQRATGFALKKQADAIPDANLSAEVVAGLEAEWQAYHEMASIKRQLAGIIPPALTVERVAELSGQWLAYNSLSTARVMVATLTEPKMSKADIETAQAQWVAYDRWEHRRALETHLLTCPACNHQWATGGDDWDAVKDAVKVDAPPVSQKTLTLELERLQLWGEAVELRALASSVSKPEVGEDEVKQQTARWRVWLETEALRTCYVDTPQPGYTEEALRTARTALAEADRKADLRRQADAVLTMPDRTADLSAKRRWVVDQSQWHVANRRRMDWEGLASSKRERAAEIGDADGKLKRVQVRYDAAVLFEQANNQFRKEHEVWVKGMDQAADLRIQADGWSKAKEALIDLRGRVKAYLLPSLNKVASHLIGQMTDGKRVEIKVDEDFDVMVDGQPINTLSGSGKAVANLALRIALGLVLTNRVFSVFAGDELDASMDADRAAATAKALANLTQTVKQVIVVSHKPMDADNYIDLGEAA